MGLHGKGIFGQSRATTGHPWIKCPECGKRHYLRNRTYEKQWREDPRCFNCKRNSVDLEKLLNELEKG